MSVTSLNCPTCSAPLIVATGTSRIQCSYCNSALVIEQSRGEMHLEMAKTHAAIEAGASITQAELRRLQLGQELAHLKTRLTALNSEIRTLERTSSSAVTKRQLAEVFNERGKTEAEILRVEAQLHPVEGRVAAQTLAQTVDTRPTWQRIISLLLVPTGRISQLHYVAGAGMLLVLFALLNAIAGVPVEGDSNSPAGLLFLIITYSYMALAVKRYHDLGKSGWWTAIAFIPFGIFYQWYELLFLRSVNGPNQYGDKPAQDIGALVQPASPRMTVESKSAS